MSIFTAPFSDQVLGVFNEGQGFEAQEVHLYEAAFLNLIHGKLGGHGPGFSIPIEGHIVGEFCLADDDSRCMEG